MVFITQNQIPDYLKNSDLYIVLNSDEIENKPFEIHEVFYRQELIIDTFQDLIC